MRVDPEGWAAAVADVAGPQIVVGGPGTGKSEFLVRRLVHLLEARDVDPARTLVLSFGRRGVADLAMRVRSSLSRTVGRLDIATFHSYALRLVEAAGVERGRHRPPQILTGPEQTALVRELLAGEDPTSWSPAVRPLLSTRTFAAEVTDFILRVNEQLIDDAALGQRASRRQDWRGLAGFIARYRRELERRDRIDYGHILVEAVRILDEGARPAPAPEYVLVDEYQDTTAAQAALLERLVEPGCNLTVAGDPHQSIYSFRGARLGAIGGFTSEFGSPDHPARRFVLTTSFRTPARILQAASTVIAGSDPPGGPGPVIPARGRGRVDVHVFDQQTAEAEWVAAEIARLHLSERIPLSAIGVFVRSKRRFLAEMSRALDRRRIPHDDPDARLAEQPAVRFVLDAVRAATGRDGPAATDRAVRRLLLGQVVALSLGRLRDVERVMVRMEAGWPDSIRRIAPEATAVAELVEDPSWAVAAPAVDGFWRVWSGLPQLEAVVTDPARRDERAAWTSLAQVLTRWNERSPEATLEEYLRLLEDEEFEARPLLSYRRPEDERVALTTLHQSKGLEFDIVFICDAVDGVFPDLRARDSLLGTRHLLPDVPEDAVGYRSFRLQEERRLAYTAMGRALRRVVWTATSTGFEDGRGVPSRFLSSVAGSGEAAPGPPPEREEPVTLQEAEAYLRRTLADPAAPPPLRLAALSALAGGPERGFRQAEWIPGVRERGPDVGLVPRGARLSPTQAESYDTCPRRYALERRLRIGEQSSLYADFGSVVHEVLERVEREAIEQGHDRSALEDAIAVFDRVFPVERFGGGVFAAAWRSRGHRLLEHLYTTWPAWGVVVGLEHPLTLDVAGSAWVGRADRIEARDGKLKIIDYKTGKSAIAIDEAAESIQLGFYLLAAAADADMRAHGEPAAAEMWYPAAEAKSLITRAFDPARLADVPARLAAVAAGITREQWPPSPNRWCDRCSVRLVCPAWPEGGEAFA